MTVYSCRKYPDLSVKCVTHLKGHQKAGSIVYSNLSSCSRLLLSLGRAAASSISKLMVASATAVCPTCHDDKGTQRSTFFAGAAASVSRIHKL